MEMSRVFIEIAVIIATSGMLFYLTGKVISSVVYTVAAGEGIDQFCRMLPKIMLVLGLAIGLCISILLQAFK